MKEGELKKLRREDLLMILIDQQRQIDSLTKKLKRREAKLENRRVAIEESGNLAEAALRLNNVYETAQKSADLYVKEMRARADEMLEDVELRAAELETKAENDRRKARDILEKARAEAEVMLNEARKRSQETGARDEAPARRGLFGRRRG